ncbi:MAG: hypothetical protein WC438_02515 [Candidatus Pacearchaeota archaeon]
MIPVKRDKVLITPKDIKPSSPKFEILGTFNPGATRLPNGDIILYVRVMEKLKKTKDKNYFYSPRMIGENSFKLKIDKFPKKEIERSSELDFVFKDGTKRLTFISHFRKVILDKTGFRVKYIDEKPSFYGVKWDGELGVEDPRIIKLNDLYIMTYVTLSLENNISSSYSISNDCINWYRRGIIFGQQDKDVVMFPEMINKSYVAFDRPEGNFQFSLPHIWVAYSDDLDSWGHLKSICLSKKQEWDYSRTGAGPPPIKTKYGWLFIYHGVAEYAHLAKNIPENHKISMGLTDEDGKKYVYSVGAALLELQNPTKVLKKSVSPILIPNQDYEEGTFEHKRVIFPTGLVEDLNKKDLLIFSGGGDTVVSVKQISLQKIINSLKPFNCPVKDI